jgi:hypothetical protein
VRARARPIAVAFASVFTALVALWLLTPLVSIPGFRPPRQRRPTNRGPAFETRRVEDTI